MKTKPLLLLYCFFILFFSCRKNEEISILNTDLNTEFLTKNGWIRTSIIKKFNTTNPRATESNLIYFEDSWSLINDCHKDNIYYFYFDKSFDINQGPLICASSSTLNASWEINLEGSLIVKNNGYISITWDLLSSDKNSFEVYSIGIDPDFGNTIVIITRFESI